MSVPFQAGRLSNFVKEWRKLTSDPNILDIVRGCHIDIQLKDINVMELCAHKSQYNFNALEAGVIEREIKELLKLGVIIEVVREEYQVISPIFVREKKNGEYRMVLNLKKLNQHIPYKHFKMESFELALNLITTNMFMASVDLRHAYYSIKIAEEQQKYFCFAWDGQTYQFTCLANGVSEGPRLFTKLLKPVFARLRGMGHIISGYIDDSLLGGSTFLGCSQNVRDTTMLLSNLGFIINEEKSVLIPTNRIEYLGNIIDSKEMVVQLPDTRVDKLVRACTMLYEKSVAPIREVAKVIGLLVASFSAVELGKLYYRHLEMAKIQALRMNKGNFNAPMVISDSMKSELCWWINNIRVQKRRIVKPHIDVVLYTDASMLGWGASFNDTNIGGRWTDIEATMHINALELQAIWLALRSFQRDIQNKHVKLFCDNTTAVNYVNEMGGIHSTVCNEISFHIWSWCIDHGV